MTNQRYRTGLSIASPSEIERTARQLTTMRKEFLTTGVLAVSTPRPIIFNSWQRCQALHVNPARRYAPLAIAREAQLQNLREANEVLIRATHSVLSYLTDFLADSGYVVVLSDAKRHIVRGRAEIAVVLKIKVHGSERAPMSSVRVAALGSRRSPPCRLVRTRSAIPGCAVP